MLLDTPTHTRACCGLRFQDLTLKDLNWADAYTYPWGMSCCDFHVRNALPSRIPIMVAFTPTTDELLAVWPRVRGGGRSAGSDGVTLESADRDPGAIARSVADQLADGSWAPTPWRRVQVDKPGGGVRELAVPAIRDRLLAAALLSRIEPLLRQRIHASVHAYVPGRGAHSAVEQVESWRQQGDRAAFSADIRDYFPSISIPRLFARLSTWLPQQLEVLAMIRCLVETPWSDGGPVRGLPQGLSLSPLLSNAYLTDIDRAQTLLGHYLRYCDNLLLLGPDRDGLERRGEALIQGLGELGLHLKPHGTVCAPLSAGIPFLGFTLTDQGVRPGRASLDHLQEAIAEADAHAFAQGAELPRANLDQHVQRWASYFRRPLPPAASTPRSDAPELVQGATALLDEAKLLWTSGHLDHLTALRPRAEALSELRDLAFHRAWGAYCLAAGLHSDAEKALRRHLALAPADACAQWLLAILHLRDRRPHEALAAADACIEIDPGFVEGWRLLASCYRLLGAETLAASAERSAATVPRDTSAGVAELLTVAKERPRTISTSPERDAVLRLLGGHDAMHAIGGSDSSGRAHYRHRNARIDHDLFRDHLAGRAVVASYLVRADGTARVAALDIDIASKVLQRHRYHDEALAGLRQRALEAACALRDTAVAEGLDPVLEDSGGRGYHLWFFFENAVPALRARDLLLAIRQRAGDLPSGINLEVFPANERPDPEVPGNRLRLPCGVHPVTRRASRILDRQGQPVAHALQAILGARRIVACDLERVFTGAVRPAPAAVAAADPVATLLSGCAVLQALEHKVADYRHLAHHERWVLGSCLKPLGEAGHAAAHRILGQCQNYDKSQTDKNLRRTKDQPIGCRRIQLMLPGLATNEVCRCSFRLREGRYPSPTCHVGLMPHRPVDDPAAVKAKPRPIQANTGGQSPQPMPAPTLASRPVAERLQRARQLARSTDPVPVTTAALIHAAKSDQAAPQPAPSCTSASIAIDEDEALVAAVLSAQERLSSSRTQLAERLAAAGGRLQTRRGSFHLIDGRPCLEL